MQTDMHYYGTYAMARAAGLSPDVCRIAATAAQFVDDNAGKRSLNFRDGARIDVDATAHHALDVHNTDPEDQRQVWVPFHFMPGNVGDGYTARLVCAKNSLVAREMVDRNLGLASSSFGVALIGITAHVYADTFSHYGFSGVSSRQNKIVNDSIEFHTDLSPRMRQYLAEKAAKFQRNYAKEGGMFANIKSWFAENLSGALGHGAVLTYPDRPYLKWSFVYEATGKRIVHDNPGTFLEGCEALHEMFQKFGQARDGASSDSGKTFAEIKPVVQQIIGVAGTKQERIDAWQANTSELFVNGPAQIPVYDANDWLGELNRLDGTPDSRVCIDHPVFHFYQAASDHRNYVIRELLPSHGLVVD